MSLVFDNPLLSNGCYVFDNPALFVDKKKGGGPDFKRDRFRAQILREDEELLLIATLIAKGLH